MYIMQYPHYRRKGLFTNHIDCDIMPANPIESITLLPNQTKGEKTWNSFQRQTSKEQGTFRQLSKDL